MALSARGVDAEKRPGLHGDGRGLYLRVGPGGTAKSWILRFQLNGKRRDAGLGSVEFVTLAEARDKAYQLRKALRFSGVDPIEEKRAAKRQIEAAAAQRITFAELAEEYVRKFSPSWKSARHAWQWRSTLDTYVLPIIGERQIGDVDTAGVLAVLNPIWLDKTETASRVRGRIESVIDYATSAGRRSGENPARWRNHLENLLPRPDKVAKVAHYAAIPYDQIADLMSECAATRSRHRARYSSAS
jgi:hypothetical protein